MKCSVVVLALGALTCTLVSPLGAAMWGGARPFCGCSASACYCPHGSKAPRRVAGHDEHVHGSHAHGGSPHNGHRSRGSHSHHGHGHPAPVPVKAVQAPPAPSADTDHCPELTTAASERKHTGERCELRHCGGGSMPGAGVLPALPDGDLLASTALPAPDLWGSPGFTDPDCPPDVFPGVEPPPPRR